MPNSIEHKATSKHRKLVCRNCRKRKSKCDGLSPVCSSCAAYKDECVYDKAPSIAYVRSLEDEVQELKNQLKAIKTQAWVSKGASSATHEDQKTPQAPTSSSGSPTISRNDGSRRSSAFMPQQVKWEADISVDDHGSVTFHGSTSAVHEPPSSINPSTLSPPPFEPSTQLEDLQTKQDLVANADKQKQLEDFGIANSAAKINLPKEISEELLKYHWCWIHPLFLFVYRPAFTRGMTLVNNSQPGAPDPPYFSETLLRVMHAHCARFLNHNVYQQIGLQAGHASTPQPITASEFMHNMTQEARISLGMETLKPSAIPTIQALLQQSAREIVFGRSSQGWLYGGMAFRMAFDMGIHLPSDKLQTIVKSLTAEDIEVRKRLLFSCYSWDKILSLYLGRMPGFTPVIDDIPLTFMDDYSDSDLWYPYYGETPGPDVASNPAYIPCPGYVVSCFQYLCKLTIILCDLLQNIYSSETSRRKEEFQVPLQSPSESPFMRISRDLSHWWTSLPDHLKIKPDQMPALAPPVHIMSLNLLYYTILILLNRPVVLGSQDRNALAPQRSYSACLAATAAIHDLLLLQANTFGLSHVSYLNSYCAYTAATIAILRLERELKPGEDHTTIVHNIGLAMLVEALQRTSAAMPALERSYAIIRKRMNAVIERHKRTHPSTFLPSPTSTNTPMPAFSMSTPTQAILAQPTAFQAISNPALTHGGFHAHNPTDPTDPSGQFLNPAAMPLPWQSDVRGSLPFETDASQSAFSDEWLPAFPGQQFPVGSEHSFGSNDVDSQSRMALLGFNLDPHPRLSPSDIDWSMMDGYHTGAVDPNMKFEPNPM